jgi:cytochrome c553
MHGIRLGRIIVVAALSVATPDASHAGGYVTAGKDKSLVCAACHATSDPASETPHIAGQGEAYLARQLKAFREGERSNPLMNAVARQLSDTDIDDLAAYWAREPPGSDPRPPAAALAITRSHMGFPKEFPGGFVLYLTANNAEQKTVRKTYINAVGFQAVRAGKPLPDGTVVIAVIYAPRLGPDKRPVMDRSGAWTVDRITGYAAMEARAGWGQGIPAWLRNATWNYALFTADKKPRDSNQAPCLACHKPQAAVGYVFTFNELWDKARTR